MYPPEPILPRLVSPDLPSALLHEPDVNLIMRREGGAVTVYGGPLTTAGERRLGSGGTSGSRWRARSFRWSSGPDGAVLPRSGALGCLAAAADGGAPAAPRLPAASAGSRSRFRRDQ